MRRSVEGVRVAAAIPSRAREAMSMEMFTEYAARTDATLNPAAPISRSRRRPTLSPKVPMVTRKPAIMNE